MAAQQVLCPRCGEPFVSQAKFRQVSRVIQGRKLERYRSALSLCPKCRVEGFARQLVGDHLERGLSKMAGKVMLVDVDQCTRCYACEIACKQENSIPVGPRWRRVITLGPRQVNGEPYLDFVPTSCLHCDDPPCAYFCPTGAIKKRLDGVVIIEEDKCNGCQLCIYGCPYGVVHFDPEKDLAGKCNLCTDRLDHGLEPSCVQHCIGGSIQWVPEEELAAITRGLHSARIGRVCYISNRWKLKPLVFPA